MKKIISIVLLCTMLLACFAGCGAKQGQIDLNSYAGDVNAESLALAAPTTKPTTDISTWTGGNIGNGGNDITASNISVNIDAEGDYSKNTIGISGADITWFDPTATEHTLDSAADLVGFLALRLLAEDTNFKNTYKEIAERDLNYFDAHTFNLETHVDLNDINITAYNSNIIFEGTFDGKNNAIMNFNMAMTSGSKGLFSQIQGDAEIRNLSLFDVDYTVSGTNKETGGSVVGRITSVTGKTAKVTNVYSEADFTAGTASTDKFTKVGGIVGDIKGTGAVEITDCVYGGTMSLSTGNSGMGDNSAGIVAVINGSANVTISNCSTTAAAKLTCTKGARLAGILAYSSTTGTLTITGCTNAADISTEGAKDKAAGIVAEVSKTSKLIIDDCHSTADATIWGKTQVGGIVATLATLADVEITNCTVASTVKAGKEGTPGNIAGGMIGYVIDCTKFVAEKCTFSGTFTGDRATGGIIGFYDNDFNEVPENQSALVKNCDVTSTGTLNIEITNSNPSTGGIVGRVRGASFNMQDCDFAGKMTVTFSSPDVKWDETNSKWVQNLTQKMAAGGLIGILFDDNPAQAADAVGSVTNCTVTGTLRFLDNTDALCTGAIFVGGSAAWAAPSITYNGLTCNGVTVDTSAVKEGEKGTPMNAIQNGNGPTVIGYQTSEAYPVGEGEDAKDVYDLRYVAVLNDSANVVAAGFKVTINYKTVETVGEETVETKVNKVTDYIVYADVMYKSIIGTAKLPNKEEIEYTAESFYGDYLYTLVIKGIDVDYSFINRSLEIIITPFTAVDAENLSYGYTADHGTIVITEAEPEA